MTMETHAHTCIYSHVLFTTLLAPHKHSYLFSNTAQSRKNYYRKLPLLPLMLNCVTRVFREFIKSCKQTLFYLSKDGDGGHSTYSCVYMGTDTHCEKTKKYKHFKILQIILY